MTIVEFFFYVSLFIVFVYLFINELCGGWVHFFITFSLEK